MESMRDLILHDGEGLEAETSFVIRNGSFLQFWYSVQLRMFQGYTNLILQTLFID